MKRKSYRRRQLIKAFFIFQCKLFLDWFRDLIFSPVALFCVVVDLIAGADEKTGLFNRLMLLGVASDRWINMFNSHSSEPCTGLMEPDTLMRDNIGQPLRCQNESET